MTGFKVRPPKERKKVSMEVEIALRTLSQPLPEIQLPKTTEQLAAHARVLGRMIVCHRCGSRRQPEGPCWWCHNKTAAAKIVAKSTETK